MLPKFREIDSIPDPEQRALALTMFRSIIAIEDESYEDRYGACFADSEDESELTRRAALDHRGQP